MHWFVLFISAVLEAVWATALGQSEGLSRPVPTVVFLVAGVLSFLGLAYAVRRIPIGTGYAVWTGLGAALTVAYAMITGVEAVSMWKLVFLAGIIAAVVGLQLAPNSLRAPAKATAARSHPEFGPGER